MYYKYISISNTHTKVEVVANRALRLRKKPGQRSNERERESDIHTYNIEVNV